MAVHIWSDIDSGFTRDASGNLKMANDLEAVKASIRNILFTSPNERPMMCGFGAGINAMVFRAMRKEDQTAMSRSIKSAVESWDNRISVLSVTYVPNLDQNSIDIIIEFKLVTSGQVFSMTQTVGGPNG